MKITKWISWEEAKEYPEHGNIEEARWCVIEEARKKGIRFDGLYHDEGRFGVPVFDDGTRFTTSWRGWGRVMHMAYPDETESYVDYYMNPMDFNPPYPDPDWNWELALDGGNAGSARHMEKGNNPKKKSSGMSELDARDLRWHPVYSNNDPMDEKEGIYCLLFRKTSNGKIFCCKLTIGYQFEEMEPFLLPADHVTEAYTLHINRYYDVKGPLRYPIPCPMYFAEFRREENRTLSTFGVNDYGTFIRVYKTLEKAKEGALYLCSREGFNKNNILRKRFMLF